MKLFWFSIFLFMSVICISCNGQLAPNQSFGKDDSLVEEESTSSNGSLTLCCWNTQTFFDAVCDGTEYSDFQRPEKWTVDKYSKRLDCLCEVMTTLNPDIMVLEEIENEAVVQDISNRLASSSWDKKKSWQYACFAKESGTAIGCAVFSRLELSSLKVHSIAVNIYEEKQPASRPLMEVAVNTGDYEFMLYVCHWKSKSGGEKETEIWRDWQESVLAARLSECGAGGKVAVICGDFNRSAEDFIVLKKKQSDTNSSNIVLRSMDKNNAYVYSPWISSDGNVKTETGSYFYQNEWERIDNIFSYGNIKLSRFQAVSIPPVADEEGKPVSYKLYSESGYSDHLPLKCVVTL